MTSTHFWVADFRLLGLGQVLGHVHGPDRDRLELILFFSRPISVFFTFLSKIFFEQKKHGCVTLRLKNERLRSSLHNEAIILHSF